MPVRLGVESTNEKLRTQVAEIQLSYKPNVKASERPKITSSKDAYVILLSNWDDSKIEFVEQFKVVLLNRANKVLGIVEISSGGVSGTVVDPKLIFAAALKANSSSILLCHNHPLWHHPAKPAGHYFNKKNARSGKNIGITSAGPSGNNK